MAAVPAAAISFTQANEDLQHILKDASGKDSKIQQHT